MFTRAQRVIPGGVNSPVRSFASVGGEPFFVARGRRPALGRRRSRVHRLGPELGRGDSRPCAPRDRRRGPRRRDQGHLVRGAHGRGDPVGRSHLERVPSVEKVRLTNSGTEAGMTAVRVARGRHRAQQGREVRRLLPRSPRRTARCRRQWCAHPGRTGNRGRHRWRSGRHDRGPVQRSRGARRRARPIRRRPRGDPRRAGRRQHGPRRARPRIPRGTP